MTTDTSHLITPNVEAYEALRDSIKAHGQQQAVLLAHDGSIIDGNQRMKACGELGIVALVATVPDTVDADPLTIEAFALMHNADTGRTPIPAERDRIVLGLADRGTTHREITAMTGVPHGTVNTIIRSRGRGQADHVPTPRRTDKLGRNQPARRTTPNELARKDELIAQLYRKGHSSREIGRALGVDATGVVDRLKVMGMNETKRNKGAGEITEPCPWRDGEVPAASVPPRWRQSRPVSMAQMLNDEYRESNFANVLANHVTDAIDAGDTAWVFEAELIISAAIEKLGRARLVVTDEAYRVECRNTHEGDEHLRRAGPTKLRAV